LLVSRAPGRRAGSVVVRTDLTDDSHQFLSTSVRHLQPTMPYTDVSSVKRASDRVACDRLGYKGLTSLSRPLNPPPHHLLLTSARSEPDDARSGLSYSRSPADLISSELWMHLEPAELQTLTSSWPKPATSSSSSTFMRRVRPSARSSLGSSSDGRAPSSPPVPVNR
jgi:hypothetical protein